MRWLLNLLPMLLLSGQLAAQNPCSITDVTVQVVDCANGQFSVQLNFQHENTGQQGFTVVSNNGILGTFQYADLPVTVGPFTAGTGIFYGFVISDVATPNCSAVAGLGPVATDCTTLPCDQLTNLGVDIGDCNADGTFRLTIGLDISPLPSNFFFEVFTSAGVSLGTFPLSSLPLLIEHYPNSGGSIDSVKVCLNDLVDCCLTKKFNVPSCPTTNCDLSNLMVDPGACNPDGSYSVKINFDYPTTNPGGNFTVYGNGNQNLGSFPLANLPLEIPNFPGGNPQGVVKVCIDGVQSCCETKEFQAPNCPPPPPSDCNIYKVRIKRDTCTSDTTYTIKLSFLVDNPDADSFRVYANNSHFIGTYPLDSLPLTIVNFPYDGGSTDKITICVGSNCCVTRKFRVPDCLPNISCDIFDLVVGQGDCTSDSTYNIKIKFNSLGADSDSVLVKVDGNTMGTFLVDTVPIMLTDVPWNGGNTAQLNVCYTNSSCCETKNFPVPDCLPGISCEIFDVRIKVGDCNPDGTSYSVKINFDVANADADSVHVWGNNGDQDYGLFALTDLPITIPNFTYEGGSTDNIRICLSNDCCVERSFKVPNCLNANDCHIYDVKVRTGACNADGTYRIRVNFKTQNATSDSFNITAGNGDVFGPFALSSQPAFIKFFPASGGMFDEITICLIDSSGTGCCQTKKFKAPACPGGPCDITNLVADPGACNPDGTYHLVLNFASTITDPAAKFEVTGNGQNLGLFALGDLPLTIEHFPNSNTIEGHVTVCMVDHPNCCATIEFQQPQCPSLCGIVDLVADPGACNPDGSYSLVMNFSLQTPGLGGQFHVYGNNQDLGSYGFGDLPLTIPSFPNSSGAQGILKVCLDSIPNCCSVIEFQQPNCPTGPCEITNLAVDPGDCNPNGTFNAFVAFTVNGTADSVDIYGNDGSVLFGRFPTSSSPVQIVNFPSTPGSTPTVKVCAADNPDCCATTEFQAPNCPSPDPCHIYDLQVLATPCIAGQFFAILSFNSANGSAQGFTINNGNGTTYGNYQYGGTQPIILGPLVGDGTTHYVFVVQDLVDPNCGDVDTLGVVDCQQIDPRTGSAFDTERSLAMSPNPVSDWLTVSAVLPVTTANGQATVQVFGADGRMVRSMTVADVRAFNLDVSGLQPGLYRLSVLSGSGRVNGTFAKQ